MDLVVAVPTKGHQGAFIENSVAVVKMMRGFSGATALLASVIGFPKNFVTHFFPLVSVVIAGVVVAHFSKN
jgi:hypothetical protein